jgi:RNA polymerase sigma-70 factor, ECF subfamily
VLPADASAARPRSAPVTLGAGPVPNVREPDQDTAQWLAALGETSSAREDAIRRLHEMLLRVARAELRRRGGHPVTGPELDDLAHQSADDAVLAIMAKLSQFRGESRFTTWACKFVILEVSAKLGRHFWQRPAVRFGAEDWDRLPDRFAMRPDEHAQQRELIAAVRRAVEQQLTARQRQVFVAIAINGVPLDALVAQLGSNRNAIYKTMFDARRKLRAALAAEGYLGTPGDAAPDRTGAVRRS